MAKNTGHKEDSPDSEILEETDTFEEMEIKRNNSSYSFRIQELLQKCDIEGTPTYTLYKYDNPVSGDEKSFIERYVQDDPPGEEVIGTSFGSGRYMLIMAVPWKGHDSLGRVYKFKVHSRYDKIAFQQPSVIPQQSQVIVKENSSVQMFDMFERFMRMITPLLIRPQDPDIKAMLFQNYRDTAEVLKKQQVSTIRAFEGMREQIETAGEDMPTGTAEREPSIIEQITPFVQQFLPLLIGGGKKAEAASTLVKSTPQFAAIVKDRGNFQRLLKHLDTTEGKEKTDKILSALKLKR